MMVKTHNSTGPNMAQTIFRWIQIILACILLLAGLGILGGMMSSFFANGSFPIEDTALLLGAVVLVAGSFYCLLRLKPFSGKPEPVSNRTRLTRKHIVLQAVVGFAIALAFSFAAADKVDFFGTGPLPAFPVMVIGVCYLVSLPLLGWMWLRTVDEHEAAANNAGAVVALYVYAMITPVWWLGARADLLPPQEPMIVFIIVMFVSWVVWAFKRGA